MKFEQHNVLKISRTTYYMVGTLKIKTIPHVITVLCHELCFLYMNALCLNLTLKFTRFIYISVFALLEAEVLDIKDAQYLGWD